MKLPRWLTGRGPDEVNAKLVGCWQRVEPQVAHEDAVEIQFSDGGRLRYCVLANDKWQIMKLTYRVDGSMLVTDQPSAPRGERTRFSLDGDDALVLEFGGERSTYRRGKCRAPVV